MAGSDTSLSGRTGGGSRRAIAIALGAIFLAAPLSALLPPALAAQRAVDLRTWKQEGVLSNGNWVVSSDGSSLLQTINGDPTFFVSPTDKQGDSIRGRLKVETTSDDDLIGFVFGYRAPLSSKGGAPDVYDTYVFDWKQSYQNFAGFIAQEGFSVYKLTGSVSTDDEKHRCVWEKNPAKCPQLTLLGTSYGSGKGWADNTEYEFELVFTADRIRITIKGGTGTYKDGVVVFDVSGSFQTGRFGFYNYSQERVRYTGFTENRVPVPVIAAIAPAECVGGRGTLQLDGSASHDPDGDAITLRWSAPGITFSDPTAARTSASFPVGSTTVTLSASDGAVSTSATAIGRVTDTVPPVTTSSESGLQGRAGWWRSAVTVTLTATDACGVAATYASVDGAPDKATTRVDVAADGLHTVRYHSLDLGGNREAARSIPIKIDQTPPVVSLPRPERGSAYVNGERVPLDAELPVTLIMGDFGTLADASDATSGMDYVEFTVDGRLRATTPAPDYAWVWSAGQEWLGDHALGATAFDVAGNSASIGVTVKTVPTTVEGVGGTAGRCQELPPESTCGLPGEVRVPEPPAVPPP